MLVRNNATALYRQIAAVLRTGIADGSFDHSGRLPSEAELGQRFGVSRVTVRLALHELTAEGLIERRRGKGTYVAGRQVRHELDRLRSFHESLLLQGLRATMRIVRLELIKGFGALPPVFGPDCTECLVLERLHLVDGETIAFGRSYLPAALRDVTRSEAEIKPTYSLLTDRMGSDLQRANVEIGAQSASSDMAALLGIEVSAAVLTMERTSFFSGDQCAEHSTFYVRPERYCFVLSTFFQP